MAELMSNLELFRHARGACTALSARFPGDPTLASIQNQLGYLIDVELGHADRSRLPEIILGRQAAYEIEPMDMPTAEILFEVADRVRKMTA